jgi:hypothetical protein
LELYRNKEWITSISKSDNPTVKGFLVEKVVLGLLSQSTILSSLFGDQNVSSKCHVTIRVYTQGYESNSIDSSSPLTLYIPAQFNAKSIDCLLIYSSAASSKKPKKGSKPAVTIIPIQITIANITTTKLNKSISFFNNIKTWSSPFKDHDITYEFLMIARDSQHKPASIMKSGSIDYTLKYIKFSELAKALHDAVEA